MTQNENLNKELAEKLRELEDNRTALLFMLDDLEVSRKKLENAHQEWMAALDTINTPIFLHDAEFRILKANRAYADRAGLPFKEIIGKPYWEIFPKRDGPLPICAHNMQRHEPSAEEEVILDSGEIFISRSYQVFDAENNHVFSVHVMEDITQHQRMEEALRESEEKFASIARSAQDAILVMDSEGLITFWNDAASRIFGYSAAEVMGKELHAFLAPAHFHPAIKEGLPKFAQTGTGPIVGVIRELTALRKNSEEFPVELSVSAMKLNGKWCAVGIMRDISKRKQAEDELKNLNRTLATLSACNMLLVHATDESQLLNDMCRLIVETGGYATAWVGYADHDEKKTIRPVAANGIEISFLASLGLTWADTEEGQNPCGKAIRTGTPQVEQDIEAKANLTAWEKIALQRNYAASISLPLAAEGIAFGAIGIYSSKTGEFSPGEVKLLEELAGDLSFGILSLRNNIKRKQAEDAHRQSQESLKKALENTIQAISTTLEMRDPYTAGHQRRVALLAAAIAVEMGLPPDTVEGIRFGGLIHDIGKIRIPAEILSKPGRLTYIEYELIKTHPEAGQEILNEIDFPWPIARMVAEHHERLDGSGYPKGLKVGEISLEAKILAVADVVEAMASHRPYRPGLGIDAALMEIEEKRGTWFDSTAVDTCLKLFREKQFQFENAIS